MRVHPSDDLLRRLVEGIKASLLRQVLRHLLECRRCRERLRRVLDGEEEGPARVLAWPARDYRPILDRVIERAQRAGLPLRREQAQAPMLFGELLLRPESERRHLLDEDPRFASWPLADLILDRSFEASFDDPEYGEALAALGLAVTDALERTDIGRPLIADLRARGLAYLANARRMRSDLSGADEAMTKARSEIARGTGDPVERARLLDLEASLRKEQRRLADAARLLRRAISAYRAAEETRSTAKALIKLAEVQRLAGKPEEAVALLREAVEELDPRQDHKLLLCARHNLATALVDLDQFMEARRVFRQTRPLYLRFPDPWTQRRRLWLAGRIDLGLGQLEAAERRLEQARRGFLEQEIVYDAALVSLDLAAVYARQGRSDDLRRLAHEMLPVFNARGVHGEARRALGLFQRAAEVDLVTVGLVQRLLGYLHRARHDPNLRFEA
jgi:tetratricopeptide (TPR) repeat protein